MYRPRTLCRRRRRHHHHRRHHAPTSYHAAHDAGALTTFNADGSATCLCDVGKLGQLCNADGTGCQHFVRSCLSESDGGDLLQQNNPTCNSVQ